MKQFGITKHLRGRHHQGFSLIEMILYIALVSIIIGASVRLAWNAIYTMAKVRTQTNFHAEMRFVTRRIGYELRNAKNILVVTPTMVCVETEDGSHSPTKIYLSGERIRIGWGGGDLTCATTESDAPLTPATLVISALQFTNRSSGLASQHVGVGITASAIGGIRQEFTVERTYDHTFERRGH